MKGEGPRDRGGGCLIDLFFKLDVDCTFELDVPVGNIDLDGGWAFKVPAAYLLARMDEDTTMLLSLLLLLLVELVMLLSVLVVSALLVFQIDVVLLAPRPLTSLR